MTRGMGGRGVLARLKKMSVVERNYPSRVFAPVPLHTYPCNQPSLPPPVPSLLPPLRHYTPPLPCQSCPSHISPLFRPAKLSPSTTTTTFSASVSTSAVACMPRFKADDGDGAPPENKKQKFKSPQITLIDVNDKVSSMSLDQAQRLAKRQDLKVVKVEDPTMRRGDKDVYRLLTGKQYFEKMKAKRSEDKSVTGAKVEKNLVMGAKIDPHDLSIKLQNITKWLSKGHQIKVVITCKKATKEDMNSVFSTMEEEIKKVKGRILQRHEKMNDMRFYIAPPKTQEKGEEATNEATKGDGHVDGDHSPH